MKLKENKTNINHKNRITFYLNGSLVTEDIDAGISTLDWLNNKKQMFGTKCSCNEGDCGACTVVIAYPIEGTIVYEAINSCLYPAAKLHGRHLISVEAIGSVDALHPIQAALLQHHGTQCGYCTPGFVMSMFALFATHTHPDKETIFAALEGNLCRCTGYQSILEAAEELSRNFTPAELVPQWCRVVEPELLSFKEKALMLLDKGGNSPIVQSYLVPESSKALFDFLAVEEGAVCIAGGTDLMVQMNIARKEYPMLIDITRIPELSKLYLQKDGLHIGACVTFSRLQNFGSVKSDYPELYKLLSLIASQQIRNFGTLGGNIANASPVGDSLPLLLAMGAELWLQSELEMRLLPLREFFIAYKQTALQPREIVKEIILPPVPRENYVHSIKTAKRKSVDISSVVTAVNIEHKDGRIVEACLALGGVAAIPSVSNEFSKLVTGKSIRELDSAAIAKAVAAEYQPLSDVRGSAVYRSKTIENHILIYLDELQEAAL